MPMRLQRFVCLFLVGLCINAAGAPPAGLPLEMAPLPPPMPWPDHDAVGQAPVAAPQTAQAPMVTPDAGPPPGEVITLSLEDAVELGRQQSFRLIRTTRFDAMAEMRLENARAARWPRVDLTANLNHSLREFRSRTPTFAGLTPLSSTFQGGATLSALLPLDVAGTLGRQVRQAELSRESSALAVEQAGTDVAADIRVAYVEALRAQEALDADSALVDELQVFIGRVRNNIPDVARFLEVELTNAQQALNAGRTGAAIAQSGLKQSLRLPPETKLRLTSKLDARVPALNKESVIRRAMARRSDVRDAKLRLEQAEISVTQARDMRRPSVNVIGYYNNSGIGMNISRMNDSRYQSSAVILNVNIPIAMWDGGVTRNAERTALMNRDQIRDDIVEMRERVSLELRQLIINLDQAERRLANLPSVEAARDALEQAETNLLGTRDWQAQVAQVTNARNTWRLTQTAAISALADYYSNFYRLKRAMGEE